MPPIRISDRTESDWLATFKNHRLTLLTSEDDAALRGQAPPYWLDRALAKLYSPVAGPQPLAWQEDPFGLFNNWLLARAQETPVRPRDQELSVSDGERHYVVLPLTLRVPAFAIAGQQALMPVLEQARQAAQQAAPRIEIIQGGVVLHAAAAAAQAQREMSTIGIGSLTGILLLIWITFRSFKPIVLVALSIAVGCLGALSISWLVFERIHLITLVFGASLIGVAQDYGIYFFCKRLGANDEVDSWRLLRQILPALILTLVTTLIGYFSLVLTPFPGLRQMALFSAVGLIFAWFTVVFWFPTLVHASTLKNRAVAERYGRSLTRWPRFAKNRRTLGAALAFAGLAGFGGSRLTVQDDIRSLQDPPKRLLDDQLKLGKILDLATPVQFFLAARCQRRSAASTGGSPQAASRSAGSTETDWRLSRDFQLGAVGASSTVAASTDRAFALAPAREPWPHWRQSSAKGKAGLASRGRDYSHRRRRSPSRSFFSLLRANHGAIFGWAKWAISMPASLHSAA